MAGILPAIAAFSGGLALHEAVQKAPIPQLRSKTDGAVGTSTKCKISVRVIAASVHGLGAPGRFTNLRPFLDVALGGAEKQTEPADFAAKTTDVCAPECNWRFADTLTFAASLEDLQTGCLQFRLRLKNDVVVGPLQVEFDPREVGEASASLRQYVLPACVNERQPSWNERRSSCSPDSTWSSPLMLLAFSHIAGGACADTLPLGQPVAHVAMQFSVDMNPESMLRSVNMMMQPIGERLLQSYVDNISLECACRPVSDMDLGLEKWLTPPPDAKLATARAGNRAWSVADVPTPLKSPDLSPDGWVCRRGPKGRKYWHHTALGPAPWEEDATTADPGLPSPEDAPADWTCHRCPFTGRTFWHHAALGPAPWLETDGVAEVETERTSI